MEVKRMIINEFELEILIVDAVNKALAQQDRSVYQGFADVKRFIEISGISKRDMEDRVIPHPEFEGCVTRFDGGSKRYIHINSGLQALDRILLGRR